MKRTIAFLFLISILLPAKSFAQAPGNINDKPKIKFSDHLFFGGGIGLQFGTETMVQISPIIGYKLTDRLSVGLSGTYSYYKIDNRYFKYSTEIYGGGVFSRYLILENLFAHVEWENLSLEVPALYGPELIRTTITSVLVGGGYRQMMGERSGIDLLLLYNLNESINSPYRNPIIRVGFVFGI